MSREIKFRAWAKDAQYIMSWRELINQQNDFKAIDGYSIFTDDNLEVIQYTGLKDKKGVEIFEGDVIEVSVIFSEGFASRVFFKEASFMVSNKGQNLYLRDLLTMDSFKVVGNIYENPELLEKTVA